jgi:hypothetical protein
MERISENLAIELAVRLANMRTAWLCTMRLMVDHGFLTESDMEGMRDHCMAAAKEFAMSSSGLKREFGVAGIRDMDGLFKSVLRMHPA